MSPSESANETALPSESAPAAESPSALPSGSAAAITAPADPPAGGSSNGLIFGVIAIILVLVAAGAGALMFLRRKARLGETSGDSAQANPPSES
jgi:hypothetical protein